jgi:single-stranded-DNA-specific exonuclease
VHRIAASLEVSELTASVLVRRGHTDTEAARAFLDAEPPNHDPLRLGDMRGAVAALRAAISRGERICVHGDYDVDGICATALAVLILRELGAEVEWHLPSRFDEGYGVSGQTLARLAKEGFGLVLTVDCGVTAVTEVDEAKRLGLDVVVTDHHRPGDDLPDCPVVATRPSQYPFQELCGTGVVYKLGEALLDRRSEALRRHLDLVALATIADVVPLVDENRAFASEGLRALARTQKPGLRALLAVAHIDAATVDAGAVGFRLAPRINAAGRLGNPRAALELLLTEDKARAAELAGELERLNRERQSIEDRILRDAVARIEEWPEPRRRTRGFVLADEGWHQGVIGIVASRLVERYHRPVVLIAGSEEDWKGSGRSIASFDLHAALSACAAHLQRFGGHRAAAGLSIRPDCVDAFERAFAAHANAMLGDDELRPVTVVDAVLPRRTRLTLELCEELARLAPFGLGNPPVTLLAPACELEDLAAVGDGKHLRFRVRDETGADGGSGIAFRLGSRLDSFRRSGVRYDVAFRLEANHWNGTVAPQLVVQRVFETPQRYAELIRRFEREWRDPPADVRGVLDELGVGAGGARRHLLESERFRELLADPQLAEAA